MYYVYLLRCADGSLYTGVATDPQRRFAQHAGRMAGGAKYTAAHRPLAMEAAWAAPDRSAASKLERRIKALPKEKKELLCRGGALPALDAKKKPADGPAPYIRMRITGSGKILPPEEGTFSN